MAAAVPVAIGVKKGVEPVVKELKELLTGDIVTIEGQLFREVTAKFKGGKKSTRLVPINYMFRINALSILLAVGGAGLTAMLLGFALWWSQLRLNPLTDTERGKLELRLEQIITTIRLSQETLDGVDILINLIRTDFADDPTSVKTNRIILSDVRIRDIWQRTPVENLVVVLLAFRQELTAVIKKEKANQRRLELKMKMGLELAERVGFGISGPSLFG